MTAEGIEVAVEGRDVDGHVGHRLGAVDQHQGADGVGGLGDLANRQHRPEGVRHVGHGDQTRMGADARGHVLEPHLARVGDGRDDELRPALVAHLLPGHDVRVVLEGAHEHLITLAELGAPPALGDQVDALRRAADEDHLREVAGADEAPHLLARALVTLGGALGQLVHAAVDVGAVAGVGLYDRVDDRLGLEGGGRAVEVDEGTVVHRLVQGREARAHTGDVEGAAGRGAARLGRMAGGHGISPRAFAPGRRATSASASRCRTASSGMRSTTLRRNAKVRTARAVSASMPRARR